MRTHAKSQGGQQVTRYPPYHEMTPVDRLLSDIVIRVQLSHADYHKAVHRYETIEQSQIIA